MSKNIRIVAPAKAISEDLINNAVALLSSHGHQVSTGQYVAGSHHYFSGTETERLSDLQAAISDESVDIILCARGGYGCIQIVDELDFSPLLQNPKLIVGFSDITVFHLHCHHLGIQTAHATMPLNFADNTEQSIQSLLQVVDGRGNQYKISAHPSNIPGKAKGALIGGNLAIIHTLIGTDSDCDFSNKILFIEDVSEYVYTIDRMFWALKKAKKLQKLAGLIVGGMTDIKDTETPFGKTLETIITNHVAPYGYPVCFNFPAGHIHDNRALLFGKESVLEVGENEVLLKN